MKKKRIGRWFNTSKCQFEVWSIDGELTAELSRHGARNSHLWRHFCRELFGFFVTKESFKGYSEKNELN